jgi:hypothetical protein
MVGLERADLGILVPGVAAALRRVSSTRLSVRRRRTAYKARWDHRSWPSVVLQRRRAIRMARQAAPPRGSHRPADLEKRAGGWRLALDLLDRARNGENSPAGAADARKSKLGAGAPAPEGLENLAQRRRDSKEGNAHPRAVNPARDTGRRLHRAGLPGAGCASLAAVAVAICRCGVALILPPPALNRRSQISQHARRNYRDSRSARPIDYGQGSLERRTQCLRSSCATDRGRRMDYFLHVAVP